MDIDLSTDISTILTFVLKDKRLGGILLGFIRFIEFKKI